MNVEHYKQIFEDFKLRHSYLANGVKDWSPRGDMGVRVFMVDGTKYDYYARGKVIRQVEKRPMHTDDYDEDDWREVFADRLCEFICSKGLSQQSLADYTGLSKGSINKYINKTATPSAYALTKLARALDCTIMELTE